MTYKVAFNFADGKTQFCTVQGNEVLLDAALRAGIKIPLDCREGVCATCQGRCESGQYTQDYVDDESLSASDLAQRKVLTCQTRVQSDAAFYFDFDSTLCHGAGTLEQRGTVSAVVQVSPTTAILHVDASAVAQRLDYLPGQYARIQVPGTDHKRSYSFANQPNSANQLQFLIRLLPDGAMSNYVRERCQVGDELVFEAPLGAFYLRHITRPLVMVAGGTGLSAFLGMLDEIAERGGCGQPVHLYYGVRQAADLCELERIAGYAKCIPGFSFTPVISDADPLWHGKCGYVTEHFELPHMHSAPFDMYLCGPPPMVESVKNWLNEQGLENSHLYYEKFAQSNT
ncbi:anthranilate 1,2-dioxygenase electron transfer component AntC [Pseudomonas sp. NPDC089392]|uniref:anthranilate 1,2-dioxygenase electron transfer component AntC n=1 Tax=Pseudomonas sp. NPDC089392 TaxID=3364459 RepID=UPI003813563D